SPQQFKLLSLSYSLLDELNKNFVVIPAQAQNMEEKSATRIRQAANYVNKNYGNHITLSDMANELFISPQHCSRFFKQCFNMSFLEYLNYIRLTHALDQIKYTDESITQIAFQNGFPNLSSFNRVFKQHLHTTPNEYRKKEAGSNHETSGDNITTVSAPPIPIENLKQFEQRLSLTSNSKETTKYVEDIKFINNSTTKGSFSSDNILNLGLLSDCLMHNYYIQISDLQTTLHFKYVRFHGVLDDNVISKIPTTGRYNYQYIDMIFDHFLEIDLVPFIEIGNIPQRLSFSLSDIETYVDSEDPKSTNSNSYNVDYNKFRHLLKHCIYRYGMDTVESWHFEIWMDFERYSFLDDMNINQVLDSYIEHYLECHAFIKAILPNAHIGGPGFNTVSPFSTLNEFFKKASLRNLEMDFITAYLYPYKLKREGISKDQVEENVIVGDENTILNRLTYVRDSVSHSSYSKKPIFIPEYHFSVSPRNHMNDTCFQACFILKNLVESNESVRGIGYYKALDMSTNYSDSIAPVFGGPGFITKDNIKKPSYYAYSFLNSVNHELVEKGKGYVLTRISGNKYRLLLYYYLHPDTDFLLQPKNYPARYFTEKISPDAVNKKVNVRIDNMANSEYVIKHRFVNPKNGSVLNEWVMLNSSTYLSRNDISYLRNICVPHQTIEVRNCDENHLTFNATLMPHEIRLIEITPFVEN
ncbi:MAG: GH39 family glycosyl hydrolase, partial [Suipraeoptans sp.]